jgi:signal transduction histidine kinase
MLQAQMVARAVVAEAVPMYLHMLVALEILLIHHRLKETMVAHLAHLLETKLMAVEAVAHLLLEVQALLLKAVTVATEQPQPFPAHP